MSALTEERNTREASGEVYNHPVAAAVTCLAGGIAVLDAAGNVKPAVTATGLVCVGRFEQTVDNSAGLAAALTANVKAGIFRWANSEGADEITKAEIGDNCYLVDDQTVAKTSDTGSRSVAGRIVAVDSSGVWVAMGFTVNNAPADTLLASNNLADLDSLPTARTELGVFESMSADITVGAEGGNSINVAIQLLDSAGDPLAVRGSILAYLSDDANGDSIAATAPDGNVAIGADGLLIPVVADKAFQLVSEADGDIDLDIGESGADTWYLILVMPDGRLIASDAITFA